MSATLMMVTYNRLDLTKQTITALLENKPGIEYNLVIVDNGSTDGTVEYLEEIKKNHITWDLVTRVELVLLPKNEGIAVGRNIALKRANEINTNWFCTIDNDVSMPSGWLQECIDIMEANRAYGAIGVNMEGAPYPIVQRNGYEFQDKPSGNLGTACMVFRKELHKMIGYFTTEYGMYGEEDADFGMRARVAGFKLGYIKEMGSHLGADEDHDNDYRKFKTTQHRDNLALFKHNCARYFQKTKPLFIPYKDKR